MLSTTRPGEVKAERIRQLKAENSLITSRIEQSEKQINVIKSRISHATSQAEKTQFEDLIVNENQNIEKMKLKIEENASKIAKLEK